jgi:sugar phosphate isomerase/epimerase
MSHTKMTIISDEVSQDPAVVARFIRDLGLSGFELRSMFGRAFKDLTARDVAEIRALAAGEGWRIHGCATPVFKCDLEDGAAVRENVEVFRRSLDVARELQCGLVRVFTFLRRPEALSTAVVKRIASHLSELADLAASSGVLLGIENESSCTIGSGAELLRLADMLVHPAAGWIWDPCNVLYVPGEAGAATAGFSKLSARIVHIHVKDAVRLHGAGALARPTPVGDGDVGWERHLSEIRRSGYAGLISLETHWRKKELDKEILHLPAGEAFSAGGDEASRSCMRRLLDLWEAAK